MECDLVIGCETITGKKKKIIVIPFSICDSRDVRIRRVGIERACYLKNEKYVFIANFYISW